MWEFVIGTLNLADLPETIAVRSVSQRTHRETLKEAERMASQYSPASDCVGNLPPNLPILCLLYTKTTTWLEHFSHQEAKLQKSKGNVSSFNDFPGSWNYGLGLRWISSLFSFWPVLGPP